jgi:hypothetical protein
MSASFWTAAALLPFFANVSRRFAGALWHLDGPHYTLFVNLSTYLGKIVPER